jgi:hypothetical protein
MGVKEWWLANQQDERERFYVGRAGMWAFSVMAIVCMVIAWIELANDRLDIAMSMVAPVGLGTAVFFGCLVYWKVTR